MPPFARDVLALFAETLSEVHFPDVDLALLESTAEDLRRAQCEVERAVAALDGARAKASAQAELLTARAERALAYARVYAGNDPVLSTRVAGIGGQETSAASHNGPLKKRGRRKKSEIDTNLFSASLAAAHEANAAG